MGARAGYVARQFERQALRLAIRGGALGLGGAALILALILYAAPEHGRALLGDRAPGALGLLAGFLALPLAIAAAAALTARLTVLRRLALLP